MAWTVLFDEDFNEWYQALEAGLQDEIMANVKVLKQCGPQLNRPRVDTVKGSAFPNMKELRVQYRGDPWRILFALIHDKAQSCWSVATRLGKKIGTWLTSGSLTRDLAAIFKAWNQTRRANLWPSIQKTFSQHCQRRDRRRSWHAAGELMAEELTLSGIREARRQSQAELASKLGVKQPAISKMEAPDRPVLEHLAQLHRGNGRRAGDYRSVSRLALRCITQFKPLKRHLAKKD